MRFFFILFSAIIFEAQAGCKLHNAEWLKPNEGPKVTQVARDDPTKVKVDWSSQLDDQRCIDSYKIYYWKSVDNPSKAKSARVKGPVTLDTNSLQVFGIEPCTDYNFQVEFEQNGVFTSNIKKVKSGITKYSTQAFAKLKPYNEQNFKVSYHFDTTKSVHDLKKAVLAFNKDDVLTYPNCISSISVRAKKLQNRNKREPPPRKGFLVGRVPNPSYYNTDDDDWMDRNRPSYYNEDRYTGSYGHLLNGGYGHTGQTFYPQYEYGYRRPDHYREKRSADLLPDGGEGGSFNNGNGGKGGSFNNGNGGKGASFNNGNGGKGGSFNNGHGKEGETFNNGNGGKGGSLNNGNDREGGSLNDGNGGKGGSFNNGNGGKGGSFNNGNGGKGGSFNNGNGKEGGSFNNGNGREGGSLNDGNGGKGGSFNNGNGGKGGSFNNGNGKEGGSFNNGNGRDGASFNNGNGGKGGSFNDGNGGKGGSFNNGNGREGETFNNGNGGKGGSFNNGNGREGGSLNDGNGGKGGSFNKGNGGKGGSFNNGNDREGGLFSNGNGDQGASFNSKNLRQSGSKGKVFNDISSVVMPPFNDTIAIEVDLTEPCRQYVFDVEIKIASNRRGEIKDLLLPPVESLVNIEIPNLVNTFKMRSSIGDSCMEKYLRAIDGQIRKLLWSKSVAKSN